MGRRARSRPPARSPCARSPRAGNPVVYGEWLGAPGKPTVLVYGHYDVQPADPLEKWHSPPFDADGARRPAVRARRVRRQGADADPDQGRRGVLRRRPARCRSTSSACSRARRRSAAPNLDAFIRQHNASCSPPTSCSRPTARCGASTSRRSPSRAADSRASSSRSPRASKDLHSGRHGGGVANPLHAMARSIASLHDAGRPRRRGRLLRSRARAHARRSARRSPRCPSTSARISRRSARPRPFGEPGYTTLERQWTRPTLEVNGMWGGYQGPGRRP